MKTNVLILAAALLATPAWAQKSKLEEAVAKADSQAEKGKPEEAHKNLQKFADSNASPEAYVALARFQLRHASPDEAVASANKAVSLSAAAAPAAKAEALAMQSYLDLMQGSGKDAAAHAQQAVAADGASATAHAALARAQARTGDGNTALQTAEKAVAASATSGIAHVAKGEALLALGRGKEAEASFRKALEVEPKLTLARTRLASALLAQGNAAAAVTEAKAASDADQKSAEAFATLGRATLALDPKKWDEAIAHAQQGAFLNAKDATVQEAVGYIFEAANNFDQAQLAYGRALAADPGYVPARVAMVNVQIRRGQVDAALTDAQKIVQEMPTSAPAQLQLGRLLLRKGDWAAAVGALEKSAQLAPGVAETHARLGTAYQYTGKRAEALASYKKAVELEPANIDFRTTYGLLLGVGNREAEGIAELQKVVATPGYKSADAYINLGWLYRNTDPPQAQQSVDAYKKALEIDPKSEQAALGMGWSYTNMKSWDEAIAAFNKAMEIDPGLADDAYTGIGWSYLFKKDIAQAEQFADKAQAAGGKDTRLRQNIENVKKGIEARLEAMKAPPPAPKIERADAGTLSQQLLNGRDVAARRRAARELAGHGTDGMSALITAVTKDNDWGVRTSAASALGALGPKANSAIPHLMSILNSPRVYDSTIATKEQLQLQMVEEDFRKVVRQAVLKIQGK
jgi:tetratricopeptide (TPR) repeat protein